MPSSSDFDVRFHFVFIRISLHCASNLSHRLSLYIECVHNLTLCPFTAMITMLTVPNVFRISTLNRSRRSIQSIQQEFCIPHCLCIPYNHRLTFCHSHPLSLCIVSLYSQQKVYDESDETLLCCVRFHHILGVQNCTQSHRYDFIIPIHLIT